MLDTNMCIDLMKHHPPEIAARFSQCYVGEVVISAITQAELEYGVVRSGDNEDGEPSGPGLAARGHSSNPVRRVGGPCLRSRSGSDP